MIWPLPIGDINSLSNTFRSFAISFVCHSVRNEELNGSFLVLFKKLIRFLECSVHHEHFGYLARDLLKPCFENLNITILILK